MQCVVLVGKKEKEQQLPFKSLGVRLLSHLFLLRKYTGIR